MSRASHSRVAAGAAAQREFLGTDSPRELRVLQLLVNGPATRERIDRVSGCANGPDAVLKLRRRNLEIPCTLTVITDRDGRKSRPGIYMLSEADRRKLAGWVARQKEQA